MSELSATLLDDLDDDEVLEAAREDFFYARDVRATLEERKERDYQAYRAWRRDVADNGGEGGKGSDDEGPFGWSDSTVPVVYWTVETILPRLGVQPPQVIAKPKTPAAVAYADAKTIRIQSDMDAACSEEQLQLALRYGLILGDGPIKIPWDTHRHAPGFLAIPWWDWFVSVDAAIWHQAEVLFHRSWHTKRDLERLAKREDDKGVPLYSPDAIEAMIGGTDTGRSQRDPSWGMRRRVAGLGETTRHGEQYAIVECWYKDGYRVVLGGEDAPVLLRVQRPDEYPWVTETGRPYRPFSNFQPIPDLSMPYGISVAEMLEGHQEELSSLRSQYTDQLAASIFAPIGIDKRKVKVEDVIRGFAQPGGIFATEGPPSDAVQRYSPGSLTRDFAECYDIFRSETQLIAGSSDYAAGLTTAAGIDQSTATGMSLVIGEANKRFQGLLKQLELTMKRVGRIYDWLDRTLGGQDKAMAAPQGYMLPDQAGGLALDQGILTATAAPNVPGAEYDVVVDVGAMAPPASGEQAKRVTALLQLVATMPPPVQQQIDWTALLREALQAFGQDPDRFIQQAPPMPVDPQTGQPPAPDQGQGGEIPVGPPQPIG